MNLRKALIGILALGLIVRISAMLLLQTWIFPNDRDFSYEEGEIAYALANGQGYSFPQMNRPVGPSGAMIKPDYPVPTAWKAPLNPAIMGLAFWIFGSYSAKAAAALELFQVVVSLLTCYVIFQLGKVLFDKWVGLIAALIFALYPVSIHFAVQKVEYPTLFTLLGLVILQQTIILSKRPSLVRGLLLGTVAGIAVLLNPVILAFCPFGLLWLVWRCQGEWRTRLKLAVAIVACSAAVVAPWIIRNYLVFDRFVFVRSNLAREFVNGNRGGDGREHLEGNEAEAAVVFRQKAFNVVFKRPAELLRRATLRSRYFWTSLGGGEGRLLLVVGAAYYSVLCLGMAGIWLARRHPNTELPLIYLLSMPIPYYLTWAGYVRFRFPIDPILILFASLVLASLLPGHFRKLLGDRVTPYDQIH
jgi:4-amino-4-deoxy-L-arabinose transferase-like glycosyltransferase